MADQLEEPHEVIGYSIVICGLPIAASRSFFFCTFPSLLSGFLNPGSNAPISLSFFWAARRCSKLHRNEFILITASDDLNLKMFGSRLEYRLQASWGNDSYVSAIHKGDKMQYDRDTSTPNLSPTRLRSV